MEDRLEHRLQKLILAEMKYMQEQELSDQNFADLFLNSPGKLL